MPSLITVGTVGSPDARHRTFKVVCDKGDGWCDPILRFNTPSFIDTFLNYPPPGRVVRRKP